MGSGDPQERLWDWHEQAEGGGVLRQYLTVQRLYPNQEMSCTGRGGRVRPWEGGGEETLGRSDNNPSIPSTCRGGKGAGHLLVELPNFLNGIVNMGSLQCST